MRATGGALAKGSPEAKCSSPGGSSFLASELLMTRVAGEKLKPGNRTPERWRKEVQRVLISQAQIARRVQSLANQIEADFAGRELVIVAVLNGTVLFLADLIRCLSLPLRLDFVGVSSYGVGTESGELVFTKELRLDVRGRDVLLVDDILDTGKTLRRVLDKVRQLQPRRIKTCVLL